MFKQLPGRKMGFSGGAENTPFVTVKEGDLLLFNDRILLSEDEIVEILVWSMKKPVGSKGNFAFAGCTIAKFDQPGSLNHGKLQIIITQKKETLRISAATLKTVLTWANTEMGQES
jgi:hypothetical protein